MGWIDLKIERGELITSKMLYDHFGFQHVVGVHLYGRKAIAGPMCVVALILKPSHKFVLKPAAKLSLDACIELNDELRRKATMLNVGWVSVDAIDSIGMQAATMMAINTCLSGISKWNPPSLIFINNFVMSPLPNGILDSNTPVFVVKNGKEIIEPIIAANIVARVARETVMKLLHDKFSEYDWVNNGGFATPQHIALIKEYGISPFHRDLSNVKALQDFKAFANERWRINYEINYLS